MSEGGEEITFSQYYINSGYTEESNQPNKKGTIKMKEKNNNPRDLTQFAQI